MNLINCDHCGVVLNKDKLKFADDEYTESGEMNLKVCDYNQDTKGYDFFVKCPVCNEQVFKG